MAGADPKASWKSSICRRRKIPLTWDAVAGKRPALTVFGTDYPTPYGKCVRDYVHVTDLAAAHVLRLRRLLDDNGNRIICLGTGRGFSVREVIDASRVVINREVAVNGERQREHSASLVPSSSRAINGLGWDPQHPTLLQMIGDA